MASGPLGADDATEKHKWAESNKVYTRKIHSKGTKNVKNSGANTNSTNGNKKGNVKPALQSSQALGTAGDGNSSQPQTTARFGAASDDSSNFNRPISNGPEGFEPSNGNGVMGVVKVDNRIRIHNLSARSRSDIREIKRMLVGELDQVRSFVKQLESGEVRLSGYSGVGGYSNSQLSANELMEKEGGLRVNSEVGSVGPCVSRPFQELSVSVMENSHGICDSTEKEKRTPKANQYYRNSDFLLGKDKFPASDSNKKMKSKKQQGGGVEHGAGMDKFMSKAFKSCASLLSKLMKHKHGWVFNSPVDVKALKLHDYYTIIKHPMDLGTVKSRLSKNWYKSPREFAEDVRLTFRNAMTYNTKGQDVHTMAEELATVFEEKWKAIGAEYNLDWRHGITHEANLPTPTSRPITHSLPLQHTSETRALEAVDSMPRQLDPKSKSANLAPMARTPAPKKPKAKDPHKRDMTYEEKQRLSTSLQNLPSDKLDSIVQIIKRRNSALCQYDDEIEVDIDSVDAETLWELDRFVTNYKKGLSKNKRKAEQSLQAREEAGLTDQETNPTQSLVEAPKEHKTDENTVSASVQGEKQGASHTSSSSSSSSDSESASSGSDSDSSSS